MCRAISPHGTTPIWRNDPKELAMYDMYPDWGPARNNPDDPRSHEAMQASFDLRDSAGQRPDDN